MIYDRDSVFVICQRGLKVMNRQRTGFRRHLVGHELHFGRQRTGRRRGDLTSGPISRVLTCTEKERKKVISSPATSRRIRFVTAEELIYDWAWRYDRHVWNCWQSDIVGLNNNNNNGGEPGDTFQSVNW